MTPREKLKIYTFVVGLAEFQTQIGLILIEQAALHGQKVGTFFYKYGQKQYSVQSSKPVSLLIPRMSNKEGGGGGGERGRGRRGTETLNDFHISFLKKST